MRAPRTLSRPARGETRARARTAIATVSIATVSIAGRARRRIAVARCVAGMACA
jgi:hypothetical protein